MIPISLGWPSQQMTSCREGERAKLRGEHVNAVFSPTPLIPTAPHDFVAASMPNGIAPSSDLGAGSIGMQASYVKISIPRVPF